MFRRQTTPMTPDHEGSESLPLVLYFWFVTRNIKRTVKILISTDNRQAINTGQNGGSKTYNVAGTG